MTVCKNVKVSMCQFAGVNGESDLLPRKQLDSRRQENDSVDIQGDQRDRLLTIGEVARRLSISDSGVYRLRATKKLSACKVGKGSIRIKESVLDRYIKSLRDD